MPTEIMKTGERSVLACSGLVLLTCVATVLALSGLSRVGRLQAWVFDRAPDRPCEFWPSWGLPTDVCEEEPARTPYVVPIGGSSTGTAFGDIPEILQGHVSHTTLISVSFLDQLPLVRLLCDRWGLASASRGSVLVFGVTVLPTPSMDPDYLEYYRVMYRQRFQENGLYRYSTSRVFRATCPEALRPLWIATFLRARRFSQLARARLLQGPQPIAGDIAAAPDGHWVPPPQNNFIAHIVGSDPEPTPEERAALRACVDVALAHGAHAVLLRLPVPKALREYEPTRRTGAACRRIAEATGAELWDYTDLLPDDDFVDGFGHHNAKGKRVIADVILDRLAAEIGLTESRRAGGN